MHLLPRSAPVATGRGAPSTRAQACHDHLALACALTASRCSVVHAPSHVLLSEARQCLMQDPSTGMLPAALRVASASSDAGLLGRASDSVHTSTCMCLFMKTSLHAQMMVQAGRSSRLRTCSMGLCKCTLEDDCLAVHVLCAMRVHVAHCLRRTAWAWRSSPS